MGRTPVRDPSGLTVNQRDPTRTTTLRAAYARAFSVRFTQLKRRIRQAIVEGDLLRLGNGAGLLGLAGNYDFTTDAGKLQAFAEWLEGAIGEELFQGAAEFNAGLWTNIYIKRAYMTALTQSNGRLASLAGLLGTETGAAALLTPFHVDALQLLYTRNFAELKGITEAMSQQISRVLADGLAQGQGPPQLAKLISGRVDKIGITRARVLARTEIIHTHAEATLNNYARYGIQGVRAQAEFRTAGEGVCQQCQELAARDFGFGPGVYPLERARGVIPAHPSCRCAWLPVLPSQLPVRNRLNVQSRLGFVDVRDPLTGKLLFRYDARRSLVEVKQGKAPVIVDLGEYG